MRELVDNARIANMEASRNILSAHAVNKGSRSKSRGRLKPRNPLLTLNRLLDEVDMILVMSVELGFSGRKLIPSALRKIRKLRRILIDRKLSRGTH